MNPEGDPKRGARWLRAAYSEHAVGRSGWLRGVRAHSLLTEGVGGVTLHVGERGRLLIVGQAPAKDTDELPPFHGRAGASLRAMLGCPEGLYERHDVLNAWPWYEGNRGGGDYFDRFDSRDLAACVVLRSARVVLLGGARTAFGVRTKQPWFEGFRMAERPASTFYLVPHPSGRNRWWNSTANRSQASNFFSRLRRTA